MDIFCREVRPLAALTIQEIQFWLSIMKEHATLINLGLPCDQAELKQAAQQFENVFDDLGKRSCEVQGGEDFSSLVAMATTAVKNIFAFKRHILQLMVECKICGCSLYPLFFDHVSREALYFLKLLQKIAECDTRYSVDVITNENIFWLRCVADHLNFIRDLLDPSARQLFEQLRLLSDKYDQMSLQARDLGSMLWHFRPTNDLVRFEKDVTTITTRLTKYNAAVESWIMECGIVSQVSPLLACHVQRETKHFLKTLELIRETLMKSDEPELCCHDFDG